MRRSGDDDEWDEPLFLGFGSGTTLDADDDEPVVLYGPDGEPLLPADKDPPGFRVR